MRQDRKPVGRGDARASDAPENDAPENDPKPVDREADRQAAAMRNPAGSERPVGKGDLEDQAHATGHPVGRIVGAAGGFAAGAIGGVAAGPVGSAVGAAAGAALGALSGGGGDGHQAERGEDQRRAAARSSEALQAAAPATYRFAFNFGEDAHERFGPGAKWDDAVPTLRRQWESERQRSLPTWTEVAQAVRDGWMEREQGTDE